MDFWQTLGELHPKLVHFPLVLLLCGLLFDLAGLIARSPRCHWAGKILSASGTVALLLAFICGIYAEVWAGRAGIPQQPIELHELAANFASWGFVILTAIRLFLSGQNRPGMLIYLLVGFAWYALMIITAQLGGSLVYEYGAAVTSARAIPALSLHDLNTLATRQTDLNLRYSELMHHIFGWITLALAGSLIAHALFPSRAARLKWVGPTLLLCGGIFLFFCADLDLYRLTDLRQLRDREVQLHKTIAIVLATIGVIGLRRLRGKSSESPASGARDASTATRQARLVAVMALIGGGMLFTHVHTVAPYANVAAGVYIAHIVLGTIALLIGAASLMGDALPSMRRPLAVLFALLMCVEATLLITYNEGLPWYIGYGPYNRWGSHGGTIAPYGSIRAELTFDNRNQSLDVYLLDRFKDTPANLSAPQIDVLISRGYQETSVPLKPLPDNRQHFQATAPFLKDSPAFCARLALPIGSSMKMGYFDPWVTPIIAAIPPNEVARFGCPMHDGMRSEKPGDCPLCGMAMVPIDSTIRDTLHDPQFGMDFRATPDAGSGNTFQFSFRPLRDGQPLRDLARVHEHLLHLIIVSQDLQFFDHVHPTPEADGSLKLPYHFSKPGSYLLFAEFTPGGGRSQVFRVPLEVGQIVKVGAVPAALAISAASARPISDDATIVAEFVCTPRTPVVGQHAQLLFRLTGAGGPINDLEPYIGAMGHCAIISEDTQTYLHSHPEQLFNPKATDRGGPAVAFHTRFPRPGRYKVWGQFARGDKMIVADFVIDVRDAPLPQCMMKLLLGD